MREQDDRAVGLFETLLGAVGHAIDDVRSKLIDEGWFGRRSPGAGGGRQNDLGWGDREMDAEFWGALPEEHFVRSPNEMARPSFEDSWAPHSASEMGTVEPKGSELDR